MKPRWDVDHWTRSTTLESDFIVIVSAVSENASASRSNLPAISLNNTFCNPAWRTSLANGRRLLIGAENSSNCLFYYYKSPQNDAITAIAPPESTKESI